jgi:hypothetical protein
MDKNLDIFEGMAVAKKPLPPSTLKSLKAIIADAGGQAAVADSARVSQSQVSRFLNGQDVKLSTALAILKVIGGGITPVCQEQACVVEPQANYREQCVRLEEELIAVKRELLAQQTKIMDAIKAACRVEKLTPEQIATMTKAVVHYDTWSATGAADLESAQSHQAAVGD